MNVLEHLQELTFLDGLRRLMWKVFFFLEQLYFGTYSPLIVFFFLTI